MFKQLSHRYTVESLKFVGGQFSWFVNFLQVRGGLVGCRKRGGGLKGKITLEKFILFETNYLSLQW